MIFFFQAEDGIRDVAVTGVQTCALPISSVNLGAPTSTSLVWRISLTVSFGSILDMPEITSISTSVPVIKAAPLEISLTLSRSEERRVGKECRYRWSSHH